MDDYLSPLISINAHYPFIAPLLSFTQLLGISFFKKIKYFSDRPTLLKFFGLKPETNNYFFLPKFLTRLIRFPLMFIGFFNNTIYHHQYHFGSTFFKLYFFNKSIEQYRLSDLHRTYKNGH